MIRPAQEKDIPALAKLLYQVHALHAQGRPDLFTSGARKYSDAELTTILTDPRRPVFVWIEEDKQVTGYVFCEIEEIPSGNGRIGRKILYIDDLCVDKDFRHRGIAQKLYTYVKDQAIEMNCQAITLNVWDFNLQAKAFYEKIGLKALKTTMEEVL